MLGAKADRGPPRGVKDARSKSWYEVQAFATLAGLTFPDPYQALEYDTGVVQAWQDEQARRASEFAQQVQGVEVLRARAAQLGAAGIPPLPRQAGNQWFRIDDTRRMVLCSIEPMRDETQVYVAEPNGVLQPTISWIAPSPDGALLALGLCFDGSEKNFIRLIELGSKRVLPNPPVEPLADAVSGGVQWLGDGSGFFFTAMVGEATALSQRVLLHRLGARPETAEVDIPWTPAAQQKTVVVSQEGHVALAYEGSHTPKPIAIADLTRTPITFKPFISAASGKIVGHAIGDELIAVTDVDAPRGRLVGIPLSSDNPENSSNWRTISAESGAVMRTVTPVGNRLYLTELVDTYASIRMLDLDGRTLAELTLPERSTFEEHGWAIAPVAAAYRSDRFVFGLSSLRTAGAVFAHRPEDGPVRTLRPASITCSGTRVEDGVAVSADGTPIPFRRISRADVQADRPVPTLVHAYGGFNQPFLPAFPGAKIAFVEAGGALVYAHLRGGGEFGLDWWEQGRFRNKQNSYNDLYAVAEALRDRGTVSKLAFIGRSNGGLLGGVAITQRPELFDAVVLEVPRLDLIGACLTGYGRSATLRDRSQNPDLPEEARRLASYSPYHRVKHGTAYPAVLISAGANDPRCPPGDSRKFAARLQEATSGSAPILLHVWDGAGHGDANQASLAAAQAGEWLGFLFRQLGMALPARTPLD